MISIPSLPSLSIEGMHLPLPIFQGGMGVGVSLNPLACAVAIIRGLGLLSGAAPEVHAASPAFQDLFLDPP